MNSNYSNMKIEKRGQSHMIFVPAFDWEEFKKIPNAEVLAKMMYLHYIRYFLHKSENLDEFPKKIKTLEAVVADAVSLSKNEIEEWVESKKWEDTDIKADVKKAKALLKEKLKNIELLDFPLKNRLADLVASVTEKDDYIGDLLFSRLTVEREENDIKASDL